MTDDSGTYSVRKLRSGSSGILIPLTVVLAVIGAGWGIAVTWGSNGNRISALEKQQADSSARTDRIDLHLGADDRQLTELKEDLKYIQQQLSDINRKLDERERR